MTEYTYLGEKLGNRGMIELDVAEKGRHITTCAVDVESFRSGQNTFPCENGDYISLSPIQRECVSDLIERESKSRNKREMMVLTHENGSSVKLLLADIEKFTYEVTEKALGIAVPCEPIMTVYMKNELPMRFVCDKWTMAFA